jgi:histidine triad (HIT) family protein
MSKECVFCKIAKKEMPVEVIYENEDFFSILDAQQKIEGHSLVISKEHFEDSLSIPPKLGVNLLDCIQRTAMKVVKVEGAEGFNIVSNNGASAGQSVMHIHYHILPRKKGDKVPHVY